MPEEELPLAYAVPTPVSRARRPFWVNVTYLALGAVSIGFGILAFLGQINLGWEHLEPYAEILGSLILVLLGLIFMTKGLAICSADMAQK